MKYYRRRAVMKVKGAIHDWRVPPEEDVEARERWRQSLIPLEAPLVDTELDNEEVPIVVKPISKEVLRSHVGATPRDVESDSEEVPIVEKLSSDRVLRSHMKAYSSETLEDLYVEYRQVPYFLLFLLTLQAATPLKKKWRSNSLECNYIFPE